MSAAERPSIWREIYPIRSFDVDVHGRLSVAAVCNYLQDAAGCHAHALGVSIDQLHMHRQTWVLIRLHLCLFRHLVWRERLCIDTWPSQQERLVSHRDFRLLDDNDQTIGQCVTSWVLMDLHRRRPLRLTALPQALPTPDVSRVLDERPEKIAPPPTVGHQQPFRVGQRDLDRNGHVNHVRYIEWALETVPLTVLNTCALEMLTVEFVGEALYGEPLLAEGRAMEDHQTTFYHAVGSRSTGNDLARVKTRWRPSLP